MAPWSRRSPSPAAGTSCAMASVIVAGSPIGEPVAAVAAAQQPDDADYWYQANVAALRGAT